MWQKKGEMNLSLQCLSWISSQGSGDGSNIYIKSNSYNHNQVWTWTLHCPWKLLTWGSQHTRCSGRPAGLVNCCWSHFGSFAPAWPALFYSPLVEKIKTLKHFCWVLEIVADHILDWVKKQIHFLCSIFLVSSHRLIFFHSNIKKLYYGDWNRLY